MKNALTTLALSSVMMIAALISTGCGGSTSTTSQGAPIDPSGNWSLTLSDANNDTIHLSGLFSQTGSIVTALNILDAGNPSPFSCLGSMSMSNGQVLNVDQFSGDIAGGWGSFHFATTLNADGTHADGTYTLTPSATPNCAGLALTGTFTGDEVPSMSGSWTGTITCQANCPIGSTSGTITATLTQNDATGAVTGTYTVSGLPDFSSGNASTGQFDILSGFSLQDTLTDNSGTSFAITGGPLNGSPGLGLDRSFHGLIIGRVGNSATYNVTMSH